MKTCLFVIALFITAQKSEAQKNERDQDKPVSSPAYTIPEDTGNHIQCTKNQCTTGAAPFHTPDHPSFHEKKMDVLQQSPSHNAFSNEFTNADPQSLISVGKNQLYHGFTPFLTGDFTGQKSEK